MNSIYALFFHEIFSIVLITGLHFSVKFNLNKFKLYQTHWITDMGLVVFVETLTKNKKKMKNETLERAQLAL